MNSYDIEPFHIQNFDLKSFFSLKTVNKQLGKRTSALRLGYTGQSQYEIPYTQPIFYELDKTSLFRDGKQTAGCTEF